MSPSPTQHRSLHRAVKAAATLAVAALALTACGTTTVESQAGSKSQAISKSCQADKTATTSDPVSLTDGVGRTVKLDKPAERIAVLEWQQIEDALTLCVAPVAVSDAAGYGSIQTAVTT